jgi:hypothetical protein
VPWHPVPYSTFHIPPDASFPNGHIAKRPVLRLDIVNRDLRLPCFAIVDSGADHCSFPLSFASQLGLDPLTRSASKIAAIGDQTVPTFYWPVKLEFPGVAVLDVYAGFTAGLDGIGFGLLGQSGFFDRVKALFDHAAGMFHIEIP